MRDDELLNSIQQRSGIAGGTCGFDVPAYQHWLLQPADRRHQQLHGWLSSLDPLRRAGEMILRMLRESTVAHSQIAAHGQFQQALERDVSYQLIRVELPADAACFAEISASRHFVTVRFMAQPDTHARPAQVADDIEFALACCAL